MTSIKTVVDGIALYFDTRIKPKLGGNKKLLLTTAVNVLCQHPERIANRYKTWLELMCGYDGEKLDVHELSAALKNNMSEVKTLDFVIPVLGDRIEIDAEEIDYIVSCIESLKKEAQE